MSTTCTRELLQDATGAVSMSLELSQGAALLRVGACEPLVLQAWELACKAPHIAGASAQPVQPDSETPQLFFYMGVVSSEVGRPGPEDPLAVLAAAFARPTVSATTSTLRPTTPLAQATTLLAQCDVVLPGSGLSGLMVSLNGQACVSLAPSVDMVLAPPPVRVSLVPPVGVAGSLLRQLTIVAQLVGADEDMPRIVDAGLWVRVGVIALECPRRDARWNSVTLTLRVVCTAEDEDATWLPSSASVALGVEGGPFSLPCLWSANGRDFHALDQPFVLVAPAPVLHSSPIVIHRPAGAMASAAVTTSGASSASGAVLGQHFLQIAVSTTELAGQLPLWTVSTDLQAWLGAPCSALALSPASTGACVAAATGSTGLLLPMVDVYMVNNATVVVTLNITMDLDPWCNMSVTPVCDVPLVLSVLEGQYMPVDAFPVPGVTADVKALPASSVRYMNDVLAFAQLPFPLRLPRPATDEYAPRDYVSAAAPQPPPWRGASGGGGTIVG